MSVVCGSNMLSHTDFKWYEWYDFKWYEFDPQRLQLLLGTPVVVDIEDISIIKRIKIYALELTVSM